MKDAAPLTPSANERNSIFKLKQQTIHDPLETETTYNTWSQNSREVQKLQINVEVRCPIK